MDEVEETSTPMRNSISSTLYRSIVPWKDGEEFIKVYKKLYSNCIADKRWAVDQITFWEARCPSLPAAIEATVVLFTAIIQDMLLEIEQSVCREKDIQTLYCMAIVRFINLILKTETGEQRTNLTRLAAQYNIPPWVLDLRHDAAHARTPSFPMLRMGAKFAVKYLEDTYWKNEAENLCQIVQTPSNLEESVYNVITKFKNVQFLMKKDNTDIPGLEKDLLELIENIRTLVKKNKEKFVEALVKPGVFLCAEEIERLLNITGETLFLELEDALTLPETLLQFWLAVIRILHSFDLISYFMEMLLLNLEHCTNGLCQKTAVSWVICLVQETYANAPVSTLSDRFWAHMPQLYLQRLLYASMKGSHPFIRNSFKAIMERIGDNEEYYQLFYLITIYQGLTVVAEPQKTSSKNTGKSEIQDCDSIVFTAQDMENDYNQERLKRLGSAGQNNKWEMAPVNMNFADMPLGTIVCPAIPVPIEEESMYEDVEEKFIIEENDKEPTVEVKIIPDTNIFQDPEIGDMIYSSNTQQVEESSDELCIELQME